MKKLKPHKKRFLAHKGIRNFNKAVKRKGRRKQIIPSYSLYKPFRPENNYQTNNPIFTSVTAPINFRLRIEQCEDVIKFINQIKQLGNNGHAIDINLDGVKEIGDGAISMLLAIVNELSKKRIPIRGTKPKLQNPKDVLEKSGFFRFMIGHVESKNKSSKNAILKLTGTLNTDQREIVNLVRNSMETVWGSRGRNPVLFTSIVEMFRNSCDHAFESKNEVQWHLGITHNEEENLVKFSFVDNGKGITKSLANNKLKKFIHTFTDNIDLVETAFYGKIESRTGLKWRGKGLPSILEAFHDNHIRNLVIITNDVYINFETKEKKKLLNTFKGTYYYWEIDKTCIKSCFSYDD